ncbi:MAG TPA: hypothetical protein VER11_22175 [Polyangiaceae bacterium]|nr:hypothetical protein [Polyangiaceae bacterium]
MRVRPPRLLSSRSSRTLGLCLAVWGTHAQGQVSEKREPSPSASLSPFVFGNVDCPDPKTVQQAVLSLIPPERHTLLSRGVRVELEDLGESYRVTVWKEGASVKKSYSDPARECEGRARFAAVFTVLTLMPPELGAEPIVEPEPELKPAKPAPVPAPAPEPAPAHEPELRPLARLELSALYAYAPAILEAPSMHSFGAELRAALGRGALSGALSVAYVTRSKFELDGVQGELSRIPLSVGLRLREDFEAWSVAADLGLLVVAERVHATNLLTTQARSSANFGLRGGVQVAHPFGPRFAPFVGAFVWFSPSPSELSALPQGVIGNLPYFWLGGAAGVSFGL